MIDNPNIKSFDINDNIEKSNSIYNLISKFR